MGVAHPGLIRISTFVDGSDAVIEVSDSGPGIEPAIIGRIFEPLYTTKSVGKGTGQGLSIVHHLVHDRHGGSIGVDSSVGVGTTFKVRIPITETDRPRIGHPSCGFRGFAASLISRVRRASPGHQGVQRGQKAASGGEAPRADALGRPLK